MIENTPDNWVVIFLNSGDPHYRVLAGWSGGYLSGDSWRMNSGIVEAVDANTHWDFIGTSGSVYRCHKESNCLRLNNAHIWRELQELHGDKVEIMPEETDWLNHDWIIS